MKLVPGQFLQKNCESSVADYIEKTISMLSTHQWCLLLELQGKGKSRTPAALAAASISLSAVS